MPVFRNPNRIREMFTEAGLAKAAEGLLSFARKQEVLVVLLQAWFALLGMVLTLLLVIRIALSLPLPWGK